MGVFHGCIGQECSCFEAGNFFAKYFHSVKKALLSVFGF